MLFRSFATTGEYVTGVISASGNITGGNILTGGLMSATSTITSAANIIGNNAIITTIVNAASYTGSIVSVTANVTGGNILTAGLASVTGNVNIGNAAGVTWANATGVRAWTYYNNAASSLDTVFL